MSRYSQSPSPKREHYEAPPPRGRRRAEADDGQDGRWVGRSRSPPGPRGNVRGRGGAYIPPNARSRSRSDGRLDGHREPPREPPKQVRRHRQRRELPPEDAPEEPLDNQQDGAPPPRHRGEKHRGERREPRPSRRQEDAGAIDDIPRDKDKERDRRHRSGRDRERDYSRKMMEAQQASMRSMMGMMGGMGGMGAQHPMAMQMAMMHQMGHMGMAGMHPQQAAYMHAMQQQQMMLAGKGGGRGGAKRRGAGGGAGGSSSDSGDDSSSDSSNPGNGGPNAAQMAAMAAMSQWPASASQGPPPQANAEFKPPPGMPPLPPPPPPPPGHPGAPTFQARGGDGEIPAEAHMSKAGGADPPVQEAKELAKTSRGSAKKEIENLISEYRLSVACAWTMRALPPDKQKLAARIDPSGQADPSGYVAEELKNIV